MYKEFALVFGLILFVMASYYVIKFAHGDVPTRTGVVAIICLIGSLCYPAYYFSSYNSAHRQDVIRSFFPVGFFLTQQMDEVAAAAEQHANRAADQVNQTKNDILSKITAAGTNGVFTFATLALLAPALGPVAPAVSALLSTFTATTVVPLLVTTASLVDQPTSNDNSWGEWLVGVLGIAQDDYYDGGKRGKRAKKRA
jgi:hypothetical protein